MEPTTATSEDRDAVSRQLGRDPRPFTVAARCPFGRPSVIHNEPSRKMPTTFWISCPSLDAAIARVESKGGVREAQESVGEAVVEEIHAEHEHRFGVRVAGVREGGYVKCLHAFTAMHLSGEIENPVAGWTLEKIETPYPKDRCCTDAGG